MLCVCSAVSLARRIAQVMTDPCYVFPYDSDDDDDDDDGVNVGLGRLSYDSSVSAAITLCTPLHRLSAWSGGSHLSNFTFSVHRDFLSQSFYVYYISLFCYLCQEGYLFTLLVCEQDYAKSIVNRFSQKITPKMAVAHGLLGKPLHFDSRYGRVMMVMVGVLCWRSASYPSGL